MFRLVVASKSSFGKSDFLWWMFNRLGSNDFYLSLVNGVDRLGGHVMAFSSFGLAFLSGFVGIQCRVVSKLLRKLS